MMHCAGQPLITVDWLMDYFIDWLEMLLAAWLQDMHTRHQSADEADDSSCAAAGKCSAMLTRLTRIRLSADCSFAPLFAGFSSYKSAEACRPLLGACKAACEVSLSCWPPAVWSPPAAETSSLTPHHVMQVLIFANSVEGGVALRLFLESFGVRLGCLHAELPVNSRSHILASFNKGLFDILIAVGVCVCVSRILCVALMLIMMKYQASDSLISAQQVTSYRECVAL